MILTPDELAALTGRQRPAAQRRALDRMGVPYLTRPDGRPVVVSDAIRVDNQKRPATGPKWGAL